jgi:hypothetical protein
MSDETRSVATRMSVSRDMDGEPSVHLQLILSNDDDRDMDQAHFHTVEEIERTAKELTNRAREIRRALKVMAS